MHTAKVGNLVENLAEQDDLRTGLGTQVRLGDDSEQSLSDSNFPGAANTVLDCCVLPLLASM